jgi:hypothetical protein
MILIQKEDSVLNPQRVSELCEQLARTVEKTYLSQTHIESIFLYLSGAERRLYCLLKANEKSRASDIRRVASIGNISQVANRINEKLKKHGDSRKIITERATVTDEFGYTSSTSLWSLASSERLK